MSSVATVFGSLACALALLASTNDWQEYEKPVQASLENMQQTTSLAYAELCGRLFAANASLFQIFATNQEYIRDFETRTKLQNLIERLAVVCQKARERLERNNALSPFNEKVLYSSLSLKTLIENLLDKDFMEQIGNDNSLADVDIVEFGKGIDEAQQILI